jgi:GTP cyclohydrolase I
MNKETLEAATKTSIGQILRYIGEDPTRDGLKDTPSRVLKSFQELYGGYQQNPKDLFTVFEDKKYDSMVVLKNIELYSMCEHHMLPFYGTAHVAYVPSKGKVVGISKLARLVDLYAKRLQIQERICEQVTDALMKYLKPKGAACIIEARHMCMCARGVGKQNSVMITSSLKGVFRTELSVKEELLSFIK